MNVLLINGSPHAKGCTHTALEEVASQLHQEGIQTTELHIGTKEIHPCIACGACAKTGYCIFKDDPCNQAIELGEKADGLIVGSPVYYAAPNGGLCSLLDRMFFMKSYKYAYKWIAHFSDPMPWQSYANTLGHKLLRRQEIKILRNAFSKADGISVTCKHVCRYFKEIYGHSFDLNKVLVTTHIGDYRLDLPPTPTENEGIERILLHPGTIYARRGGTVICQVMQQFEKEGVDCRFVQIGEVDLSIKDLILNSKNIEVYDTSSLEKSVELRKKAKAIFIPDFESDLDYSPFILSKFVYQIMSNKPIVLYSKSDCEMHDYAVQFPEAGIFFAEEGNVPSLKKAICQAMDCDTSLIDRTRIRKCFSEEKIIKDFFIALDKLIGEDASYHSL